MKRLRNAWRKHCPKVYLTGQIWCLTGAVVSGIKRDWSWVFANMAISGIWANWRTEAKQRLEGTDRASLLKERARFAQAIRLLTDPTTRTAARAFVDAKDGAS